MLDIIDGRRKTPLKAVNHPIRHFLRRKPGILPADGNDWNVDAGEDINWGPQNRHHSQNKYHDRRHDERMRSVQCKSDYPHLFTPREAAARRETELAATVCQHRTATPRNQRCFSPALFAPIQMVPKILAPFAWGWVRFCICHASNRGKGMSLSPIQTLAPPII